MKKMRTLLVAFALLFATAVVYAAASGAFDFSGTVNLGDSAELVIVQGNIDATNDASGSWAGSSAENAVLTVTLNQPGESVTFNFTIENTGNADAEITELTVTPLSGTAATAIQLTGTYESLETQTIASASTSSNYTIILTWDSGAPAATGSATFTLTFDWALAD